MQLIYDAVLPYMHCNRVKTVNTHTPNSAVNQRLVLDAPHVCMFHRNPRCDDCCLTFYIYTLLDASILQACAAVLLHKRHRFIRDVTPEFKELVYRDINAV